MTAYLLPCSCGRKLPIEPRQAGQSIACPCGASLVVPSMLEMARLERAEPRSDARARQRSWGVNQGLILLGIVLVLLGGSPAIWLFCTEPPPPRRDLSPEQIRQALETRSPAYTWHLYRELRGQGPKWDPLPEEAAHAKTLQQYRIYGGSLLLVACVGIGLIVVAAAARTKRKRA